MGGVWTTPPFFMSRHTPKQKTYRQQLGNEWITIYLDRIDKDIWHVGLAIAKSKRAQNDWYRRKKNKRAKRTESSGKRRGMKAMMTWFRLLKKVIAELPEGHSLVAWPSTEKKQTLTAYAQRLGFRRYPTSGGETLWVLITPVCPEDLRESTRTTGSSC